MTGDKQSERGQTVRKDSERTGSKRGMTNTNDRQTLVPFKKKWSNANLPVPL